MRTGEGSANTECREHDVTVTIVSWNTKGLLRACLNSVYGGEMKSRTEVHVVDNGSTEGSPEMIRLEFPQAHFIGNQENLGFAKANNQSWRKARGRYWMLLNSDTEARPGAIDALVAFMDTHPQAGLATARLVNSDGTPQFCAQPIPSIVRTLFEASRLHKLVPASVRNRILLSTYWTHDTSLRIGWTWGTALIARREAVEGVGPLSDDFFMYGEDLEWCLRMRQQGWEVWLCSEAEVLHRGGQSAAQRWNELGRAYKIWDGFYEALSHHRSRIYVRALQAATLAALAIERLACRLRKREVKFLLATSIQYHLDSLKSATLTPGDPVARIAPNKAE
jgi:GT2 family glycosyltransferase